MAGIVPSSISAQPLPAVARRRALTQEEEEWLEEVPRDPEVWHRGSASPWAGRFWQSYVKSRVESGQGRLWREGDELVALLPAGEYRVNLAKGGAGLKGSRALPGDARAAVSEPHGGPHSLGSRRGGGASFFTRKGGTYVSHTAERE